MSICRVDGARWTDQSQTGYECRTGGGVTGMAEHVCLLKTIAPLSFFVSVVTQYERIGHNRGTV